MKKTRALDGALVLLLLLVAGQVVAIAAPGDPFAVGVRTTEPLTPAEQQKTFKLPPGFVIQLVAAEPDLRKPMNMAFDSAGRLWITESREYPFAATNAAAARDTIRIFSDFDTNGRARKVTTFATNLNIPIGLYPFRSPSSLPQSAIRNPQSAITWKCIAWSIPNIWLFEDTDGDGVADRKEILYGPFDHTRDTHGNQASFRRGFDGWLYATHGYNNRSKVAGKDGHEITMNSGNTYRMRLDGSRIEHWTHGQVNPFGLAFDPLGNLYSADCHSSPIYQLLRGAWYPSFGAPHDGLGFAPVTIQHSHGSTAICGITYISDANISDLSWPWEFQDNIFIGNVMTSRINRDKINFIGSTSTGVEQPDFLSTTDPWFRPVDLQFGPDGALYVADFYNRIIGHYEVPLLHPGRDRERGRIWRIVPPGGADVKRLKLISGKPGSAPEQVTASRDALLNEFLSSNPTRRALAREELALLPNANEHGLITQAAQGLWHFRQADDREGLMTSCLWQLHRAGQLADDILLKVLTDRDEAVRVHALRMLTERGLRTAASSPSPPSGERAGVRGQASSKQKASSLVVTPPSHPKSLSPVGGEGGLLAAIRTALSDTSAHVQRAAADALAANPHADNLPPLLALLARAPAADTHLTHVVRLALREQLRQPGAFTKLDATIAEPESRLFASIAVAVTNEAAAAFLVRHVQVYTEPRDTLARYAMHAARFAGDRDLARFVNFVRPKFGDDLDLQLRLFKSVQDGLDQRGQVIGGVNETWGEDLAKRALASAAKPGWQNALVPGASDTRNPWAMQERPCADGQRAQVMSSFPNGEALTGALRSAPFALPAKLSFYLCGHDGFPTAPALKKNFVRLRLVEERGLQAASPAEKTKGRVDSPASPRDATGSGVNAALQGRVLRSAAPPRNDTAQLITWDLAEFAGRRGVFEATDGDSGTAYAWLAFGRFEPAVPELALSDAGQSAKHQQAGADIARTLKLASVEPQLTRLFNSASDADTRIAAGRAWLAINPNAAISPVEKLVRDIAQPDPVRERLAAELAKSPAKSAVPTVVAAMTNAPARLQAKFALALAATSSGAEQVLQSAELGRIPARLLQDHALANLLSASGARNAKDRITSLTTNLQPADVAIQQLITQKRADFDVTKANAARGAELFTQACAACHQLEGKGALVGPQLDGIGGRGLDRLLEDILDSNANVDRAFRSTTFVLTNGDVVSGLFRREEGAQLIVADSTGKEVSFAKAQVKERRETERSLMPDNFGEAMTAQQFNDLLAFLLREPGPRPK